MILISKGSGEAVDIDGEEFFPKAFAMVNTVISDGLLYISEAEASDFPRTAYLRLLGRRPRRAPEAIADPRVIREVVAEK